MRILILGGDGYLGWPTAMYLSSKGHEVSVADNMLRRRMHLERSTNSLTPILGLQQRIERELETHLVQLAGGDAHRRHGRAHQHADSRAHAHSRSAAGPVGGRQALPAHLETQEKMFCRRAGLSHKATHYRARLIINHDLVV